MTLSEMTWTAAIQRVLSESMDALHYQEITEKIVASGYRFNLGATPAATVSAQISSSIKKLGEASPYLRVDKGVYTLRVKALQESNALDESSQPDTEREEQYEIISSFGMFWRREAIEWKPTPKLLGMQQIGATPVDFHKQLGIYLLYDGREVIYVGRATERPLGKRLFEHTLDRLSTRWDRFSWFGLLPITETGYLEALPSSFDSSKLIPALEAILIEALEPRQNRKRGDDLAAVEFLQKLDPEIEKKRIKASLDAALNKM